MLDFLELQFGRYNGGQNAPIGTYVNMRTMAYYQQASDGTLPNDGTWLPISTSPTFTATQIANALNNVLGTNYNAGNFHARTGADASPSPGQMSNDA
ncbi:MAG: hypothetical protein J2P37_23425 [Ktedonobacteraceae bacterium]|jgi:hypothetical protein|nr:hypothetical protein [Ktedonobacteraceae bacterium]MBO0790786.1 hypothetical protein [Ktedonobacteraceae bacterium]